MATGDSSLDSQTLESLFDEGALILGDSPMDVTTLPESSKTPTTPLQGADLATAVDGGSGEVHRYSTPSQGLHVSLTNAGGGAAPRDREELPKTIDAPTHSGKSWEQIVSEESDDSLQPGQPRADRLDLKDRLSRCLSRKSYLREKLIRTEHHVECLDDHHRQGTVPKGLQLERKFNPVTVDGYNTATKSQIEDILSKAERKIHKIMLDHHRKLSKVIDRKLEAVEEKIGDITHHPEASTAIHTTLQKEMELMERQENSLRLALQKSRQRKALKQHSAAPSRSSHNTTTGPPKGRNTTHAGPSSGSHSTTPAPPQRDQPSKGKGGGKDTRRYLPYHRRRSSPPRGRPNCPEKGRRCPRPSEPRAPRNTTGASNEASITNTTLPSPMSPPCSSSTPAPSHLPALPLPSPISSIGPERQDGSTPSGLTFPGFYPFSPFTYPPYPMVPHPAGLQGYHPQLYSPVPPPTPPTPTPTSRDPE